MTGEQRRTRRKFSAEFKRDAVELVLTGGKSVAEAARCLGIYDSTLGNWVKQARIDRGQQEGLGTEERARLRELERDNAKLRMERDLRGELMSLLGEGVDRVTRYRCVDSGKADDFTVAAACRAAGVSTSA
ncbi:Transposase and inactivated derivatives, partial [Haloechinothrix alba]